ncbi:16S rRNA (guanine(966)-N(2))-methyltransferase RsmD [Endomicrobium sp. AH-315-J14]|nr:16S rRNA (guanine(966)-N(2))-methyltransferase RsmD [Endomicrobium sp. AH-315-J14]
MRVIAGALGGRRLRAPKGDSTRPTSDKVREALFSALGPIEGDLVLDLYAGSGALAIEALSRGVEGVVLVEKSRKALDVLRSNLAELSLDTVGRVIAGPVERVGGKIASFGPYDLVLADPPYADLSQGTALDSIRRLLNLRGVVHEGTRFVLELGGKEKAPSIASFDLERLRRYGDSALAFYRRSPEVVARETASE